MEMILALERSLQIEQWIFQVSFVWPLKIVYVLQYPIYLLM